jgi:hypothetical protein
MAGVFHRGRSKAAPYESYVLFTAETQGSAKPPPWVCVVFEGGFGPKGLGNSAQAKAWAKIGVGTKVSFAPPSEPDWQISRIRLSSW